MKSVVFFFLIFITSTFFVNGQNDDKVFIDSVMSGSFTLKEKVMLFSREAAKQHYRKETKKFIDQALEIVTLENLPDLKAQAYYTLGNYHFYNGQLDESLESLEIAENYINEDDLGLLASILATRGGVKSIQGSVVESISLQLRAKKILEEIDINILSEEDQRLIKGRRFVNSNSLANLYLKIDDYEQSLVYYDLAFSVATNELNDLKNASIILSNKGELLYKMEQYDKALAISKQALQMKIDSKLPARFISMSEFHIGKIYAQLDSLELSLRKMNMIVKQANDQKSDRLKMIALAERGFLNFKKNKLKQAQADCLESKRLAFEIQDNETKIRSCDCLQQVEAQLGNYKSSLENYKLYTQFKDSIFNKKSIRNTTRLGLQYEFNKKEAEKQLLIGKKNRQRNLAYIGIGIISLFAILITLFYRKRLQLQRTISSQKTKLKNQEIVDLQQKNKLLSLNSMIEGQEAERLRIAKDLHDSLGGLLSTVKNHFSTIQKEIQQIEKLQLTKRTNSLIDEACVEVRRISHNMMPHSLSISGLKGTIEDLGEDLNAQGYQTTVEVSDTLVAIDETKKIMVYRLVQEIISNIQKHAQAKTILIQILTHLNEIHLLIEDDGVGFDYEEATKKGGLGLKSINSRVEFLDGTIHWDSEINKGSSINVTIPSD